MVNPLVLAAAKIAGVSEIYRIGGAQAVAALAYGTETIKPVVKIVGPGNAYVAAAKRQVFGVVGIDSIAGPSEVVVLADSSADPQFIAVDLLAQAEHDAAAQSILITDDKTLAEAVTAAVEKQLPALPRAGIAGASWRDFGAIIVVPSLDEAISLVDKLAPEHLEIMARDAEALSGRINNAGAIYSQRQITTDGIELTWALNHLAPFLLTELLLNRLKQSAPARIITTASRAHHQGGHIPFEDLQGTHSYFGYRRYGQTK